MSPQTAQHRYQLRHSHECRCLRSKYSKNAILYHIAFHRLKTIWFNWINKVKRNQIASFWCQLSSVVFTQDQTRRELNSVDVVSFDVSKYWKYCLSSLIGDIIERNEIQTKYFGEETVKRRKYLNRRTNLLSQHSIGNSCGAFTDQFTGETQSIKWVLVWKSQLFLSFQFSIFPFRGWILQKWIIQLSLIRRNVNWTFVVVIRRNWYEIIRN